VFGAELVNGSDDAPEYRGVIVTANPPASFHDARAPAKLAADMLIRLFDLD
jgi:hypothetical protein